MVTTVNLTYNAGPGGIIHLGKVAASGSFPPLRSGGTVALLASSFTGAGFQLLTTAPAAPIYTGASHGTALWDDARQILWMFGAETHGSDSGMDNAVYGWRASDGLVIKHYDADDKSGYRMDTNGVYWSSEAKNRPWAMHSYRRMRFIPADNEFEVIYDANDHASVTPILENSSQSSADRVPPFWYYNVVTGTWRHRTFGQSDAFVKTAFTYPVGYDATYGWFTHNGSTWTRLTNEGVLSNQSVFGKASGQYHAYMHVHNGIAYHVGGNANTYLYGRHPLNDIPGSTRFTNASFAALTDKNTTNMASVKMPDGRIVIFPTSAGGTVIHGMVLDPVANTVTDTGFTLTGVDGSTTYEMKADWSPSHNCAIVLFHRFAPDRIYAFRPE